MKKMKPDIKRLWVEALRSGDYMQAVGRLRYGDEYCCLGVLSDVYRKHGGFDHGLSEGEDRELLTNTVAAWAGMDGVATGVAAGAPKTAQVRLSNMNDDGRTFRQIAAYIDRYL